MEKTSESTLEKSGNYPTYKYSFLYMKWCYQITHLQHLKPYCRNKVFCLFVYSNFEVKNLFSKLFGIKSFHTVTPFQQWLSQFPYTVVGKILWDRKRKVKREGKGRQNGWYKWGSSNSDITGIAKQLPQLCVTAAVEFLSPSSSGWCLSNIEEKMQIAQKWNVFWNSVSLLG